MLELLAALKRLARSPGFKFFLILFLIVLLLVPLLLVGAIVDERAYRANDVRAEIGRQWGPAQRIVGPFLIVPYTIKVTQQENGVWIEREVERSAVFTPDTLEIAGRAEAKTLHRGVYDVPVYEAKLKLSGRFGAPKIADAEGGAVAQTRWSDAVFALSLSGVAGIKSAASLTLDGATVIPFSPSLGVAAGALEGVHARLSAPPAGAFDGAKPFAYSVDLDLDGSVALSFAPVARETKVSLDSNWPNPSFADAFLPSERRVDARGFSANWSVPHLARSVPEAWILGEPGLDRFQNYAMGVKLIDPVDFYSLVNRAVKYAVLFVALTFMAIFCLELIARQRVHPVQYLFTGLAMALFYVLLLSFAEHIGFIAAYCAASAATGLMLAVYVGAVLKSWARGLVMAGVLALLFAMLYVILQLEDYALIAGALLSFAALGFTMFSTLRVDWSGERAAAPAGAGSGV